MTTQSWTFAINHTSDAGFRLWGLDFAAKLAAVGLVQTADTGQIDWTSVTRASTSSAAGYEIWRFNDAMQSTAPIFLRIEYGTEGTTSRPRIRVTVGPSTNGAGTITGTALTTVEQCGPSASFDGGDGTSRQCYMCHANGAIWWAWGSNAAATASYQSLYFLGRTSDADGVPDDAGAMSWSYDATQTGQLRSMCLNFVTPAALTRTTSAGADSHVWGNTSSTLVGGVPQVFPVCAALPRIVPMTTAGIVKLSDIAEVATFTWTPFGLTSHTYININKGMGTRWTAITASNYGLALIWE